MTSSERPSAEQLAEIRRLAFDENEANYVWSIWRSAVQKVFVELDAVTKERDEARTITDAMVERAVAAFGFIWFEAEPMSPKVVAELTSALRRTLTEALGRDA